MADSLDPALVKSFAQKLAGNEKKFRDRAVKKLRKWISTKSRSNENGFDKEGMLKLWKGLHYCMWMSDKPLVQEELSHTLTRLVHNFTNVEGALLYIEAALETEAREWSKLDAFRMDKFMMFIRHILREVFIWLKKHDWSYIDELAAILSRSVCCPTDDTPASKNDGIKYHVADIYLDELEQVADGELSDEQILAFFQPYNQMLLHIKQPLLAKHLVENIYEEAAKRVVKAQEAAREKAEKEEDKEDDEEEMDMDEMEEEEEDEPAVDYDLVKIADSLFKAASQKSSDIRNRKLAYNTVTSLKTMASEDYRPPQLPVDDIGSTEIEEEEVNKAVKRLLKLEKTLLDKQPKKKEKPAKTEGKKEKKKDKSAKQKEAEKQAEKKSKNKFEKEPKKKKEGKSEKKKTAKKVEKPPAAKLAKTSGAESKLFQGGFFDSDDDEPVSKSPVMNGLDEETEPTTKKRKLESPKSKVKSPKVKSDSPKVKADSKSDLSKVKKGSQSDSPKVKVDSPKSPKAKKSDLTDTTTVEKVESSKTASKAKKRKSLESSAVIPTEDPSPKRKKRKSMGDEAEEGEIDIWIPNKKYKGPLKGQMEKQIEKQEKEKQEKLKKKSPKSKVFAEFLMNGTPPPAFMRSPKTPSSQGGEGETSGSGKKRLSFILSKNQAQSVKEYNKVLKNTPTCIRFDPHRKPDQGILKPSPAGKTKSPKSKSPKSPKKSQTPKRKQAADFF